MARVFSGLASLLARLASYFRIAPTGYAEPGTQQPARPRLGTVEEVISELRASNELPTAQQGARWAWSYICFWVDTSTGERIGRGVAHVVETDVGASYQLASAEARRRTLYPENLLASPPAPVGESIVLRCRRFGPIREIPTQER